MLSSVDKADGREGDNIKNEMKTILELSNLEAKSFFLKQKAYCSIDMPQYFDFQPLLDRLVIAIGDKELKEIYQTHPKEVEDVNYKFYSNKDGRFDWRPLQLIHPAIYVCLVNVVTETNAWSLIVDRFFQFQENKKIICCSIPLVNDEEIDKSTKKETILNWWNSIEQKSIEFALDYNCFLNTDIVNCYGSIYTHTIPWAIHEKQYSKDHKNDSIVGNAIDKLIQAMSYSQTNGIPQGSVLFDFIAEIVLGYADLELTRSIECYNNDNPNNKIEEYKILRYRDDYRIFTRRQEEAVIIAKLLSEVLQELNLKINNQKTFISTNIIKDSIKPDKQYWIEAKQSDGSLQKHLLLIHSLAEKYPNSGSVSKALDKFYDRLFPLKLFKEDNLLVLFSILVDILYKNPRVYPVGCSILAKLLSLETDSGIKSRIVFSIKKKFEMIPNIGHLQVWLQRITIKSTLEEKYDEKLCEIVSGKAVEIWNVDWMKGNIKSVFKNTPIVDRNKVEEMSAIPEPQEIKVFDNYINK